MASILKLPIEIISMITALLRLEQVFNLGSTCQHFLYILHNESICKVALQVSSFVMLISDSVADIVAASQIFP